MGKRNDLKSVVIVDQNAHREKVNSYNKNEHTKKRKNKYMKKKLKENREEINAKRRENYAKRVEFLKEYGLDLKYATDTKFLEEIGMESQKGNVKTRKSLFVEKNGDPVPDDAEITFDGHRHKWNGIEIMKRHSYNIKLSRERLKKKSNQSEDEVVEKKSKEKKTKEKKTKDNLKLEKKKKRKQEECSESNKKMKIINADNENSHNNNNLGKITQKPITVLKIKLFNQQNQQLEKVTESTTAKPDITTQTSEETNKPFFDFIERNEIKEIVEKENVEKENEHFNKISSHDENFDFYENVSQNQLLTDFHHDSNFQSINEPICNKDDNTLEEKVNNNNTQESNFLNSKGFQFDNYQYLSKFNIFENNNTKMLSDELEEYSTIGECNWINKI